MATNELASLERRIHSLPLSDSNQLLRLSKLASNAFLVKKKSGSVAMAIDLGADQIEPQSRVLGGLEIQVHNNVEVSIAGRKRVCSLALIETRDENFVRPFTLLCLDLYNILSKDPRRFTDGNAVFAYIEEWSDLFAPVRQLSLAEQVGLWGELEILSRIPRIDRGVSNWHGPESKIFDFSIRGLNLEVKTGIECQTHCFGLEQLVPLDGGRIFVASLVVRDNPASGLGIPQKVNGIRKKLSNPIEFEKKLLKLGYSDHGSFSVCLSLVEFRIIRAEEIPRPRKIDPGVKDIVFKSETALLPSLLKPQSTALLSRFGS